METAATLRRASRDPSTGRCASASPATRRSATASITSIWNELGATVCYTLDGQGADEIDVETFSADLATVTVRGVNIHPAIAKGRMVNAMRVAADFVDRLPRDELSPEMTADREGFLHPYTVTGGVAEVTLRVLLRDFDTANLARPGRAAARGGPRDRAGDSRRGDRGGDHAAISQHGRRPGARAARGGVCRAGLGATGRRPKLTIIRGGTDGSRFTELGLPTPNLSTGEHNPHSPLEWACLEEMVAAGEMLVELARVWAESTRGS